MKRRKISYFNLGILGAKCPQNFCRQWQGFPHLIFKWYYFYYFLYQIFNKHNKAYQNMPNFKENEIKLTSMTC